MLRNKFLKVLVVPSAVVLTHSDKEEENLRCKPSDLPVYSKEPQFTQLDVEEEATEPNAIEKTVSSVRRVIVSSISEVKSLQGVAQQFICTGLAHSQGLINYLSEEENTFPKYGAVAVGTIAGYIFSLRRGRFVRLIYTSAGGLTMAAVCYPKEATKYTDYALVYATKYSNIASNFIYGVKKGEEESTTSLVGAHVSNAWQNIRGLGQSMIASESVETDEVRLASVNENTHDNEEDEKMFVEFYENDTLFIDPQIPQKSAEK